MPSLAGGCIARECASHLWGEYYRYHQSFRYCLPHGVYNQRPQEIKPLILKLRNQITKFLVFHTLAKKVIIHHPKLHFLLDLNAELLITTYVNGILGARDNTELSP